MSLLYGWRDQGCDFDGEEVRGREAPERPPACWDFFEVLASRTNSPKPTSLTTSFDPDGRSIFACRSPDRLPFLPSGRLPIVTSIWWLKFDLDRYDVSNGT